MKNLKLNDAPFLEGRSSLIVMNKSDLLDDQVDSKDMIYVSAKTGKNILELKEKIVQCAKREETEKKIVGDLLEPLDFVVLVVPIDEAAPKGRLILPQQQTIRDILEAQASAIVVKDTELKDALEKLTCKPEMVITDSQAFEKVAKVLNDAPFLEGRSRKIQAMDIMYMILH